MSVYPIILSQLNFTHRDNLKYHYEERGLQFGDGIYEVIRIYNGRYHLFQEHVDRLFRSAEAINLTLPFTKEEVSERSEEHTSELQSRGHLVCRLLLEKKK